MEAFRDFVEINCEACVVSGKSAKDAIDDLAVNCKDYNMASKVMNHCTAPDIKCSSGDDSCGLCDHFTRC